MAIAWRDTLKTLLPQFEARACKSQSLHHIFVEVAEDEPDKSRGPSWFSRSSKNPSMVDGKPKYGKWDWCSFGGLPGVEIGFREPLADERFDESNLKHTVRDGSGVVRAVKIAVKHRHGYFCGTPSEEASAFESLATAGAIALAGASDLGEHFLAPDLSDLFRTPRGGARYIFGEVPAVPDHFVAQGWNAGVISFKHGVLIDLPISEKAPGAGHWTVLLHRLGWRRMAGSALLAERYAWHENVEIAWDMLSQDWSRYSEQLTKQFASISKESYYSVLGTKDTPLDVNLASAFAIQMLLADLSPAMSINRTGIESQTDYSREKWKCCTPRPQRTLAREAISDAFQPHVGILVATEIERQAVLKKMLPPKKRRNILRVHSGSNTYFLGRLGVTDIVLCMAAMGSVGRDSSALVTSEMLVSWNLPAVIIVGIAFGKDATKQEIGNVLVSDRIISYEPQRIGQAATEYRGRELSAGGVLLNRFRNALGWNFTTPNGRKCGLQIGPILSGEKLVDNADFKRMLFDQFPTAIGGEMEGAGGAAAAERNKREWIVVKAICDWGDGTKTNHHQEFAAASSVHLVEHVLNQSGSLDSLIKRDGNG